MANASICCSSSYSITRGGIHKRGVAIVATPLTP